MKVHIVEVIKKDPPVEKVGDHLVGKDVRDLQVEGNVDQKEEILLEVEDHHLIGSEGKEGSEDILIEIDQEETESVEIGHVGMIRTALGNDLTGNDGIVTETIMAPLGIVIVNMVLLVRGIMIDHMTPVETMVENPVMTVLENLVGIITESEAKTRILIMSLVLGGQQ